jgi:hypothetical protein
MREVYRGQRDALVAALRRRLGDRLTVDPPDQGMHLVAYTRPGLSDVTIERAARDHGVVVRAMSRRPCRGTGTIGADARASAAIRIRSSRQRLPAGPGLRAIGVIARLAATYLSSSRSIPPPTADPRPPAAASDQRDEALDGALNSAGSSRLST